MDIIRSNVRFNGGSSRIPLSSVASPPVEFGGKHGNDVGLCRTEGMWPLAVKKVRPDAMILAYPVITAKKEYAP
ncbi:MAG: hypothetical protein ACLR23_24440 [Clostridia bacterium]